MISSWRCFGGWLARPKTRPAGPTHIYAMRFDRGSAIEGSLIRLSPQEGEFVQSAMHPAGQSVAYWGQHPGLPSRHIWVADMVEHACRPITRGPRVHGHPAWWPDSRKLIYFATKEPGDWHPKAQFDIERPPAHLYRHCLESGEAEQLTDGSFVDERPSVMPDGKTVIFVSNRAKTGLNLWALEVASG